MSSHAPSYFGICRVLFSDLLLLLSDLQCVGLCGAICGWGCVWSRSNPNTILTRSPWSANPPPSSLLTSTPRHHQTFNLQTFNCQTFNFHTFNFQASDFQHLATQINTVLTRSPFSILTSTPCHSLAQSLQKYHPH